MPTTPTNYLLDANVFIQAHRSYYSFDLCPGFWACIPAHHTAGRILSIDKIRAELLTGDPLDNWVQTVAPTSLFTSTRDERVTVEFAGMMRWVQANPQFQAEAKAEFAQVADGWLVAYAKVHGYTVATLEMHRPEQRSKVPLPNVCLQFGVPYADTFTMLRDLGSRFELAAT
jgi:hypothetical protein